MSRRRLRITRVWASSTSMLSNGRRQIPRPATAVTASARSVISRPSIVPTQRILPSLLGSLGAATATAARALRPRTLTAARPYPLYFARSMFTAGRTAKPCSPRRVDRMKALANVCVIMATTAAIASCGKVSRVTSTTAATEPTEEINRATWGSGQNVPAIAGVANSISLAPHARTGHSERILVGSTAPQAAISLFSGKAKVDVGEAVSPRDSWGRSACVASTMGTGAAASIAGRMAASGTPSSSVAPRRSQRTLKVSLASRRMVEVSTDARRWTDRVRTQQGRSAIPEIVFNFPIGLIRSLSKEPVSMTSLGSTLFPKARIDILLFFCCAAAF
mmetsp:Transcript_73691/g.146061  ORF Transcript_73691/g.146061 Transcript_73691/m.146061 type:complete len:334 (+) Transcript_73691:552-1553(+)